MAGGGRAGDGVAGDGVAGGVAGDGVAGGVGWVGGGGGWRVAGAGGVLEGGGVVPAGSRGVVDGSGVVVHVVRPDGVSFERGLSGGWSGPRSGPGEVTTVKTGGPVTLAGAGGRAGVVLPAESEEVRDGGVTVAWRQVRGGDGARLEEPRVFVPGGGGWAEARPAGGAAGYEAWLAAANQAHEAARSLLDIAGRGGLAGLSDEGVRELAGRGGDDTVAGVYEWVRRSRGVALRWTQLAGSHALAEGRS